MDLLGCCLTFPTEELLKCAYHTLVYLARTRKLGVTYSKHAPNAFKLSALADSNWRHTRSTSGFCIFLAGASISSCCRRQGCIAMSSTEAELVVLAECAIELICVKEGHALSRSLDPVASAEEGLPFPYLTSSNPK